MGAASLMPWPLYPWRKSPQYPMNRRPGELYSWYGCLEKRNISCPCWDLNPE